MFDRVNLTASIGIGIAGKLRGPANSHWQAEDINIDISTCIGGDLGARQLPLGSHRHKHKQRHRNYW